VLLPLGPALLAQLIDAWASLQGSSRTALSPLCPLLLTAAERQCSALDAKCLIAVSRLVDAQDRPNGAAEIMLLWKRWIELAVEDARSETRGWARCREAFRGVQRWRDMEAAAAGPYGLPPGRASLAEMVLQGVVAEGLCAVAWEVPLELAMMLGRVIAPGCAAAARLAPMLESRVRRLLRGADGGLPLMVAISVANGETLVECVPGTMLWEAVVLAVASRLHTSRQLELFCRCRPIDALRVAVSKEVGGWRSLELQVRMAS